MPTTRTMEEPKFKMIDKGTYPVTCVAVRPDTLENPQYGDGAVIKFKLEFDGLEDDDGEPLTREAMASDYLTPGSKLTRWLFAFGITADIGGEIDIDDATNRQALAVVGQKAKGDKVYDTIEDLIPAPKARTHRAPAPAEAAQTPSMINLDGTLNTTVFWTECRKAGIPNTEVAEAVGGDLNNLATIDPTEIVAMFEILKAGHEGVSPDDVPFTA